MHLNNKLFHHVHFINNHNCGKARCEPSWEWSPSYSMPDYDLWYAMSGQGSISINGISYPVRKGCCFLLRPGDRIYASQDPDNRLLVIYVHFLIENSNDQGKTLDLNDFPVMTHFEEPYHIENYFHRMIEMKNAKENYLDEEFDYHMKLIFLQIKREQENSSKKDHLSQKHKYVLYKVMDQIQLQLGQPVNYEELAASVGLSRRYLSQLFKRYTDLSLKEYITRQRLERAKILLTESSMNVSQIAESLGYRDIYFFSKLFKKVYGVSPTRFRSNQIIAQSYF